MIMKRPNLIFVFADQLLIQSLGYADDELARTPHIDRLAEESCDYSTVTDFARLRGLSGSNPFLAAM